MFTTLNLFHSFSFIVVFFGLLGFFFIFNYLFFVFWVFQLSVGDA